MKKLFLVTDKSGRSAKPYKLDYSHIIKHFDLDECDSDSEESLNDYLDECEMGDIWQHHSLSFERIS